MADDSTATNGSVDSEIVQQGPFSTVTRTRAAARPDDAPRWLAVKSASMRPDIAKEPHDIIKELRHLAAVKHPNIIEVIDYRRTTSALTFRMPYIPFTLTALLASPAFSPNAPPFSSASMLSSPHPRLTSIRTTFNVLAKALAFQICAGLAHLHDRVGIAHRDIKPGNILITEEGCVKLIDFGISWCGREAAEARRTDVWPEEEGKMYFEVSTGPYRAPELLFGTRSYDAFAIDRWSLGATLAEFFTPLRLHTDDGEEYDEYGPVDIISSAQEELESERKEAQLDMAQEESLSPLPAFVVPLGSTMLRPGMHWIRHTLFNGERGEIGLAWSIFRVRGTPTSETWPTFEDLPDARSVTFMDTPPVQLSLLLPNASSSTDSPVIRLLEGFFAYPPPQRLSPSDALKNSWFTCPSSSSTTDTPLLLPPGYWGAAELRSLLTPEPRDAKAGEQAPCAYTPCTEWEGLVLGDLVRSVVGARSHVTRIRHLGTVQLDDN
ncbi:hypothetical protein HGRIS_008723 [Hohenbuehelia grisea]|uniref:cyclin-dependent kinase n=1 Tax=Hohenbuehelia grisea TaxID=104357 RepID=A0ABR3J920_9AGAR